MTRRATTRAGRLAGAAGLLALTLAPASAVAADPAAVDLGGTAITASTDPSDPAQLDAGLWADELGVIDTPAATHQYSYTRAMASSTVHLGVIGAPDGAESDGITLEVTSPTGCGSDSASTSYPVEQLVIGLAVDVGPSEVVDPENPCLTSPTITFTVARYSSSSTATLPVAIKVVEEAPVLGDGTDLPTAPTSPAFAAPSGGSEQDVEGATSFDDAPVLAGGTTYRDAVTEGGTRLYRVRLGWGESLDVQVDVDRQTKAQAEVLATASDPGIALGLVDPLRDVLGDVLEGAGSSGYYTAESTEPEPTVLTGGVPTVTYLSRFEPQPGSLPGDYWVAVAAQPAIDHDPVDLGYTVTVQVDGDRQDAAAPAYALTVQGPGTAPGPDGYAPETPFLVAAGTFAADPSGNPVLGGDGADDDAGVGRLTGGVVLAVLSVLTCGLGVRLLARSRRPVGSATAGGRRRG